jgi:hypothetical protein
VSAAGSSNQPRGPERVERRWSRGPWGIQIETWRLVETRTLPTESACLPLSVLFDDEGEHGAVPCPRNDQADTLETPPDDEITREHPAAYVHYETTEES